VLTIKTKSYVGSIYLFEAISVPEIVILLLEFIPSVNNYVLDEYIGCIYK
jgi:hypothetical protein